MKTTPLRPRRLLIAGLVGIAAVAVGLAFDKGDKAWSKRNETNLLAEPKPLAAVAGKASFAEELRIDEVKGVWVHVKGAKDTGWVFQGNLAGEKPAGTPPAGLTTLSASDTDTAAAARPLSAIANDYAARHNAADAAADIEWLEAASAEVKAEDVDTYLRDNQKGEYQP
jgi:hypothetical protein